MTSFHNFFRIFVAFLHSSQTDTAVLQISHLVAFPFWPMSANFRKFAARVASCAFVLLGNPSKFLVMSRNFLKFSFYLCPTRVNLCVASESMLPGQVERAADILVQTLAPFHSPFSFLFGRAISVFSEPFYNRMRPKKNDANVCQKNV